MRWGSCSRSRSASSRSRASASSRRRSCARTAATRSSCIAVAGHAPARPGPGDDAAPDGPADRALRGLYPLGIAARPARRRARAREEAELTSYDDGELPPTPTPIAKTESMLFDLRGAGRRRPSRSSTSPSPSSWAAGSCCSASAATSPAAWSTRITDTAARPARRRPLPRRADAGAARRRRPNPQDAAAWAAARPRALPARGHRRQLRPEHRPVHRRGQGAAPRRRPRPGRSYLALDLNKPDDRVASHHGPGLRQAGLNEPEKAVRAQEIVTEARPKDTTFASLAVLAYQAGQTRKGDLATDKALELAARTTATTLKAELEAAKQQALPAQIEDATQAGATPTGGGPATRRRTTRRRTSDASLECARSPPL